MCLLPNLKRYNSKWDNGICHYLIDFIPSIECPFLFENIGFSNRKMSTRTYHQAFGVQCGSYSAVLPFSVAWSLEETSFTLPHKSCGEVRGLMFSAKVKENRVKLSIPKLGLKSDVLLSVCVFFSYHIMQPITTLMFSVLRGIDKLHKGPKNNIVLGKDNWEDPSECPVDASLANGHYLT